MNISIAVILLTLVAAVAVYFDPRAAILIPLPFALYDFWRRMSSMLWATKEMHQHVGVQAKQQNTTASAMWLVMIKRSFIYLILPALVIGTVLVTGALLFYRFSN